MGMIAIFKLNCCENEIVFGRFRGGDMNPPSLKQCPYGCPQKYFPGGKPDRFYLTFQRYQSEDMTTEELLSTWRFRDKSSVRVLF